MNGEYDFFADDDMTTVPPVKKVRIGEVIEFGMARFIVAGFSCDEYGIPSQLDLCLFHGDPENTADINAALWWRAR